MKLADKIELFKKENPNKLIHKFNNEIIFKGSGEYRLHWWLDSLYKDAVNEWNTSRTKNNVDFLENILK